MAGGVAAEPPREKGGNMRRRASPGAAKRVWALIASRARSLVVSV